MDINTLGNSEKDREAQVQFEIFKEKLKAFYTNSLSDEGFFDENFSRLLGLIEAKRTATTNIELLAEGMNFDLENPTDRGMVMVAADSLNIISETYFETYRNQVMAFFSDDLEEEVVSGSDFQRLLNLIKEITGENINIWELASSELGFDLEDPKHRGMIMVAEWIPDTTDILYVKRKRDEYIETLESYVAGKEIDQTEEIKRLIDLMFIVGSNKRNIFQIATKEGFNRDLDDEAMIQAIKSFPISNDN